MYGFSKCPRVIKKSLHLLFKQHDLILGGDQGLYGFHDNFVWFASCLLYLYDKENYNSFMYSNSSKKRGSCH